jgi:SulP family sulfate permease
MFNFAKYRAEWVRDVRADLLSGLVVALALVPEAIAFSMIAGVDPKVGLYASVVISIVIAIFGGRPAMISAATAATAVLMGSLVRDHGLNYLLAATVLAGVLQLVAGWLNLQNVMRFVSKSVMSGFVNALAIMIFTAQIPHLVGVPWLTYPMIAVSLVIIYLFPRLTKAIPSPLATIVIIGVVAYFAGFDIRYVGDIGELPNALPSLLIPDVPLTLETLLIILPYSVGVAAVGLLESLMTAQIIDEQTDTNSSKRQETFGQGIANIVSAFFGGMAGCAMIGQSGINVRSGGRGRLSTFLAGFYLLVLLVAAGDILKVIPMPALVAIMIMVSIETFDWSSIKNLKDHPRSSSVVMLATVAVVLYTHNLAIGVVVGVLLSGVFFAWKIAQIFAVRSELSGDGKTRLYHVHGQLFFASAESFVNAFDFSETPERVVIDLTHAHIWDISSVASIDKVVAKFRSLGAQVALSGMNKASATIVDELGSKETGNPDILLEH